MKILLLNWRDPKNPRAGGAEVVTMEHAKAWGKAGHQVTWFTSRFPNSLLKETTDGVEIVRQGNHFTVFFLAPLYYFFSGRKFDLVIDEIHGLPFFTPLYVRKPKIAFIHEVATDIWDYMFKFPFNIIGKVLEPLFFLIYKTISFITVSDSSKKDLITLGINEKNIHVILNGLNIKTVEEIPSKEKSSTFIFISRLVPMKGIKDVIRAFSFIFQSQNDAQLWIVGTGEKQYIDELKQIGSQYGIKNNIRFYGKVTEAKKTELLKRSQLLLHASVKEGWGLVVIEAASQATPAVVYDVAGLRDSVKNGVTGVVLKENIPREMAKEVLRLIQDKSRYTKLQKNSLTWAKSLTWKKATQKSVKLINQVVASKS